MIDDILDAIFELLDIIGNIWFWKSDRKRKQGRKRQQ